MTVDFGGIAPVSEGWEEAPVHGRGRGTPGSALGAPSAELSLVGLRPRRARLRFTRRPDSNHDAREEQEQSTGGSRKPALTGVPPNPGGSVLRADVGPFCAPITRWTWHGPPE